MISGIADAFDYSGDLMKARKLLQVEGYLTNMLMKNRPIRYWNCSANLFCPFLTCGVIPEGSQTAT